MPKCYFSIAKFYPFLKLCNYLCENFADGFVARIQVKLSLTLLIAGVFGFVFECLNAFEYLQGIRPRQTDLIHLSVVHGRRSILSTLTEACKGTRLALIDSSLAVTSILFVLCFVRGEFSEGPWNILDDPSRMNSEFRKSLIPFFSLLDLYEFLDLVAPLESYFHGFRGNLQT